MHVYGQRLEDLAALAVLGLLAWGALWWASGRHRAWRRAFVAANALLSGVAFWGVLSHTVLGRVPTGEHVFVLMMDPSHGEFVREMFMNALLYLPLGLALSAMVGPWAALVGLMLSVGVETWQYLAGTGTAQATDVVCNALGCAIGVVPWLCVRMRTDSDDGR